MIYCIAGLLGGGKSFYAVEQMARHISSGGICYSNIRLELEPWYNTSYKLPIFHDRTLYPGALRVVDEEGHGDYYIDDRGYLYNSRGFRHLLRARYRWELQDGQYHYLADELVGPQLVEHISGGSTDLPVMVVLDEALDHFESGTSSADASFRSFLRHVRKLGIDLYFIAQDFGSLDRRIRALCHYAVNCRDLATWRAPIIGVPLPPPWRWNIQVLEWHANEFGKINSPPTNRDKLHPRDTLVFESYSSTGLHRAFPLKQVRSDFRGLGHISEEVPMWCKVLSVLNTVFLLVVLIWFRFRASPGATVTEENSERLSRVEQSLFDLVTLVEDTPPPSTSQSTSTPVAVMSNLERGGYDIWYSDGHRRLSRQPVELPLLTHTDD